MKGWCSSEGVVFRFSRVLEMICKFASRLEDDLYRHLRVEGRSPQGLKLISKITTRIMILIGAAEMVCRYNFLEMMTQIG